MVDDLLHVGNEAHVQHPISLVQDKIPHPAKLHIASLHKVEQTARGGDEDVAGICEVLCLMPGSSAPVDALHIHSRVDGKLARLLVDLIGVSE